MVARRRGSGSGRGGYQQPSNPAAVSGPGALSARTDGGPSNPRYEYSGLPYGDNKALNDLAGAAPVRGSQAGTSGGAASPRTGSARRSVHDMFGPTEHPDEPMTAGIDFGDGPGAPVSFLPPDENLLIRALAEASGHPDLVRLAMQAGER